MDTSSLRIASYNIRKARGLDQRRDPGRVIDVINGINADLVVLQEADLRLGQRPTALPRKMIEEHTDFSIAPVAQNGVSLGWHGNAVLMRAGMVLADIDLIELPGLEPRGAVRLSFEGEGHFELVATHLGLRRRDRQKQQRTILEALSETDNVVIAGDFNEWSEDKGLDLFRDSFSLCAPGNSFHARRPLASLDRFAFSSGAKLKDAGVEEGKKARRASDHLPIWCDVELSAPANTPE